MCIFYSYLSLQINIISIRPSFFSSAMSSFGTHNLYLCRRDTKQHHHDNKTHITQDTHNSDKTPLPLYHDSNHKRMLLRNRTWQRMATSRHHVLPLPQDSCRHHSPHPSPANTIVNGFDYISDKMRLITQRQEYRKPEKEEPPKIFQWKDEDYPKLLLHLQMEGQQQR